MIRVINFRNIASVKILLLLWMKLSLALELLGKGYQALFLSGGLA
jgi:hypothetical protein